MLPYCAAIAAIATIAASAGFKASVASFAGASSVAIEGRAVWLFFSIHLSLGGLFFGTRVTIMAGYLRGNSCGTDVGTLAYRLKKPWAWLFSSTLLSNFLSFQY